MENSGKDATNLKSNCLAQLYDPSDFHIKPVEKEDFEEYWELVLKSFVAREPMSLGLNITESNESIKDFLGKKVNEWMESGASVCAIHVPTNEVAGVIFTHIFSRKNSEIFTDENVHNYSENVQKLLGTLSHLESAVNFFEDPNIQNILEIALTTVKPKFTGNKLVYRMTEECEKRAVNLGSQLSITQSSNQITQHIRRKMGYKPCFTMQYKGFEIDGREVFDVDKMGGSTQVTVFKKYLTK